MIKLLKQKDKPIAKVVDQIEAQTAHLFDLSMKKAVVEISKKLLDEPKPTTNT